VDLVYRSAYGSNGEPWVVFAPRERADPGLLTLQRFVDPCHTIDFEDHLPEGEWAQYIRPALDPVPEDGEVFDADRTDSRGAQ
jgi:hypothetical protein